MPKKRPTSESPEGTRRKAAILKAATQLFARNGYRDASLASVADAVGLTPPGLLHHFPSKPDLLEVLLREREQRDKAVVADALGKYPGDVVRLLEALVAHNEAERDDTWLHTVLSAEATSPDHPAHDFFAARYTRVRNALGRTIAEQSSASTLDKDEIAALAAVCMAVMDGLQVQWLLDPQTDMTANFKVFGKLLQNALGTTAPAEGQPGQLAEGAVGR
jgi:AcrR family transcriptional regulator